MESISKSPQQTKRIGTEFAKQLTAPALIGLFGEVGAGKTTFVQGMAHGLGIDPQYYVNSPTFTLINEYRGVHRSLIHVDLYRMENPMEVETIGLTDYLQESHIIVVEWGEKIEDRKFHYDFIVDFKVISDKERKINVQRL